MKNTIKNSLPNSVTLGANLNQTDMLIPLPVTLRISGLGKSSLYNAIKKGTFPAQIKVGERSSRWSLKAVQAWVEDKIKQSEAVG